MKYLNVIAIIGGLVLTGCSPQFYIPNTQNVPLLSKKGETSLTLAGNDNQIEFQGAYAVTKGFAVKVNGGLFIPTDEDNGDGGSGKFVEFGGGYFKPINDHLVFEIYGILGFGDLENHFPSTVSSNPQTTGDVSANIFRYGIQPNFGFKSKNFSVAVSSRFVSLNYSNIHGNLIYGGEDQIVYLEDNHSNIVFEPALTIRGGFEKAKLQLQFGQSLNLSNSEFRQAISYLTIGLNFDF